MGKETKKKVANACHAMKAIGISKDKVKPVLKSLVNLFNKNWKLIEEENYRALADAIFEREEAEASECSKKIMNCEVAEQSKKIVISEKEDLLEEEAQGTEELEHPLKRLRHRHRDGQASTLNTYDKRVQRTPIVRPKEEPDELPETHLRKLNGSQGEVGSSEPNAEKKRFKSETVTCQSLGINKGKQSTSPKSLIVNEKCDPLQSSGIDRIQKNTSFRTKTRSPSHPMRLRDRGKGSVSSQSGEERSVPTISPDVERSKEPNIKCGTSSRALIKSKDEPITNNAPRSELPVALIRPIPLPNAPLLPPVCNGTDLDDHGATGEYQENGTEEMNGLSLVGIQKPAKAPETKRSLRDVIDIAKGLEKVVITLVNEVNDEGPPSFFYIPQNAVFQNAYLNFSLARMGDSHCCSTCFDDCLSSSIPCACAHETGGEFAYTKDGLVKEEFLNECISMNRDPKKHCQFFCKECVLERSKNEDVIDPCKGHLVRKFIKECWWKCGCGNQCGNRVVQRGISRKLQVFMTPEGKGWGLRTLEDLPKGAFVCEYVGEVLTNAELFDRVQRSPKGEKHSYPVLLDADWGAEQVLKDDEALCLDATYYGNVARFINHKCYDSNMVEIPVEVETPDHHYYHLAFFTTRKLKALEELTWDYGIDFDDHDHPIKAFHCQCGSKFCRNIRRSTRSRSSRRWR